MANSGVPGKPGAAPPAAAAAAAGVLGRLLPPAATAAGVGGGPALKADLGVGAADFMASRIRLPAMAGTAVTGVRAAVGVGPALGVEEALRMDTGPVAFGVCPSLSAAAGVPFGVAITAAALGVTTGDADAMCTKDSKIKSMESRFGMRPRALCRGDGDAAAAAAAAAGVCDLGVAAFAAGVAILSDKAGVAALGVGAGAGV